MKIFRHLILLLILLFLKMDNYTDPLFYCWVFLLACWITLNYKICKL